jgi:dihydroorotate dehydrogenase electron transfer subunit
VAVTHLAPAWYRIDLAAPGIGEDVWPGRFAMVSAARPDCILPRPYSYLCADGPDRVSFLVKIVGKGTAALAKAQVPVQVLGPLGNRFPARSDAWCVAGGVGLAPLVRQPCSRVLFGGRTAADCTAARTLLPAVEVATDDGSAGQRGTVVDLLREALHKARPTAILTCGPTRMMAAVCHLARDHGIDAFVSLEERMACGIGICRGCAHADASGSWRCICVDGPVYRGDEIFP